MKKKHIRYLLEACRGICCISYVCLIGWLAVNAYGSLRDGDTMMALFDLALAAGSFSASLPIFLAPGGR